MQLFSPTFPEISGAGTPVQTIRAAARTRFAALGLPNRRQEDWRFINLKEVSSTAYAPAEPGDIDLAPWNLPNGVSLVFVNSHFDRERSDLSRLPPGVKITNLAGAVGEGSTAGRHVGTLAEFENQPFVALNTAQQLEGAFIHIEAGASLDGPIHVLYAATGADTVTYPRTLVVAEEGARADIVETYVSTDRSLCCPVTEISLSGGAKISHTRVQEEHLAAQHLGSVAVKLAASAAYSLSSVSLGGALSRIDVGVALDGPEAETTLDGLTLVDGERQGAHQIRIDHNAADCVSTQRFRSVLDDASRAVFTGRIVVAEGAQKTDANQSSKSLVRSDDAVAFNNPQLEIYADDVRCTHGSTVGRLDEEALFYLRARGLDRETAEGLLTLAFAAEVLAGIGPEDIRTRLEDILTNRLATEST